MPESVNTGGGAYVENDVQAGTFIGRDLIVVIDGYNAGQLDELLPRLRKILSDREAELQLDAAQQCLQLTAPGAPRVVLSKQAAGDLFSAATRQADERAYLTALILNPHYGRWAHQFVPLAGTLTVHPPPPGWGEISPEFIELQKVGEGAQRQLRRIPLKDISEAVDKHPALVLLGEPGSGKTTTLYRLCLEAARHRLNRGEGPLPLLLPLADFGPSYASPQGFLEDQWRQRLGGMDMSARLRDGELFIFCDALNEMPFRDTRDYRSRVHAWRRFIEAWPGNRCLFTCRSLDYSEPLGMPQVEIERLDDPRIRTFLDRYLRPDLAGEAWEKLVGTPLLTLVRNPYYLSMLCFLLAQEQDWPESRAGLFARFVNTLLKREAQRNHPDWFGKNPLARALSALAEGMQPLGEGTRLPRGEAKSRIPRQIETSDGSVIKTPSETVLRLGLAATLLDTEIAGHGEEHVRFYHHQLQEYFAARALAERFKAAEDLSARWRQPLLKAEMPDPGPLRDDEPLPPPPTTGWEEPTLLAVGLVSDVNLFVQTLGEVNPVLAAACLMESGIERSPDRIETLQHRLQQRMLDAQIHVRARLAAGEALGRLGDPRFEVLEVEGQKVLLPPMVVQPAVYFRMGTGRWEAWRWSRRGLSVEDERPPHALELPAFLIGQFPVTNAEYACFVEAGGYDDERYWDTPRGLAWLHGELESEAYEDWLQWWRYYKEDPTRLEARRRQGWSPQDTAAWENAIAMSEEEFKALVRSRAVERPRDRPAYWDDARFNNLAQPAVGITWYEAMAYCRWLNAQWHAAGAQCRRPLQDGEALRLPTEAEWERTARGSRGNRYAWGNGWAADRANTLEAHLLRTSPVGVYPRGVNASGVHDLSGNVWEWTQSLYQPYPIRMGDGRNDLEKAGPRVVRGGSWDDDQGDARCAYRDRLHPDSFNNNLGFRVVVSLANPDF
jgi:formylglycine-generating enzyme required for sulfatase activity